MMRAFGVAMVPVLLASPGLADRPLLLPNRDVEVTYREAAVRGNQPVEQRMRWHAAAQTMRIDPPGGGVHVIIDYAARRMSVVRDASKTVVDMAAPDGMAAALGGKAATDFVRQGEATVAGRPCTQWQTRDRDARAVLVCVTDDGVLLRVGTLEQPRMSAVSIRYAPQDPAAFRVPAGYTHRSAGATR